MIRFIISFILAVTFLQANIILGIVFIAIAIFAYKIKDQKFNVPQQPTNQTNDLDDFNTMEIGLNRRFLSNESLNLNTISDDITDDFGIDNSTDIIFDIEFSSIEANIYNH